MTAPRATRPFSSGRLGERRLATGGQAQTALVRVHGDRRPADRPPRARASAAANLQPGTRRPAPRLRAATPPRPATADARGRAQDGSKAARGHQRRRRGKHALAGVRATVWQVTGQVPCTALSSPPVPKNPANEPVFDPARRLTPRKSGKYPPTRRFSSVWATWAGLL
jgi:hypothetical protein